MVQRKNDKSEKQNTLTGLFHDSRRFFLGCNFRSIFINEVEHISTERAITVINKESIK